MVQPSSVSMPIYIMYNIATQYKYRVFSTKGWFTIPSTLINTLRYVVFASTLVETQYDARIDSDPIFAFPCVAFLRQVVKKPPTFLVINLCISRINATQGLASLCEPALIGAAVITPRACAGGRAIGFVCVVCRCRHENRQISSSSHLCVL